jgi:hypothetical protein
MAPFGNISVMQVRRCKKQQDAEDCCDNECTSRDNQLAPNTLLVTAKESEQPSQPHNATNNNDKPG